MTKTGVLVMAHGTPQSSTGILAFYTRIRRGRPPSDELLTELTDRYGAIGGTSPLAQRTSAQVDALRACLDPSRFHVVFGAKHTDPSIEDAVEELCDEGVSTIIALVLAPHRASMGSAEYFDRVRSALEHNSQPPRLEVIEQWWDAPGFAALLVPRVHDALRAVDGFSHPGETLVLFTAHSLPMRVVEAGDDYPDAVAASAAVVAGAAALAESGIAVECAWQSAGRTADPWIGPDILDVLRGARARGFERVVVCPIGFTSDHLEVLYDLDIEAKAEADRAGLAFARTASLNADERFAQFLADVVMASASK